MKSAILLALLIWAISPACFAADRLPLKDEHFSIDASSEIMKDLIESVFNSLKLSGEFATNFPCYGKTEIVGDYWAPHTIRARPVASAKLADSILVSKDEFISFEKWGLNQRAVFFTDFVYLLKEKDDEAIRNGFTGRKRNKYIEVSYKNLMPITKAGTYGGDFSEANKIVLIVRKGLSKAGCRKL